MLMYGILNSVYILYFVVILYSIEFGNIKFMELNVLNWIVIFLGLLFFLFILISIYFICYKFKCKYMKGLYIYYYNFF